MIIKRSSLAVAASFLVLSVGCGGSSGGETAAEEACVDDSDCPAGMLCSSAGNCIQAECLADSDCAGNEVCDAASLECRQWICPGDCLDQLGILNGLGECSCTNTCETVANCLPGETCTWSAGLEAYLCIPIGEDCTDTDEVCYQDLSCVDDSISSYSYCSAGCEDDLDCPIGFVCDADVFLCILE
jgi:hypothetical protein